MQHALLLIVAMSAIASQTTKAQCGEASEWVFRNRPYYDPIVAEPRGANVKALLGVLNQYPYAESSGSRLGMDLTVGKEIPGCRIGKW